MRAVYEPVHHSVREAMQRHAELMQPAIEEAYLPGSADAIFVRCSRNDAALQLAILTQRGPCSGMLWSREFARASDFIHFEVGLLQNASIYSSAEPNVRAVPLMTTELDTAATITRKLTDAYRWPVYFEDRNGGRARVFARGTTLAEGDRDAVRVFCDGLLTGAFLCETGTVRTWWRKADRLDQSLRTRRLWLRPSLDSQDRIG